MAQYFSFTFDGKNYEARCTSRSTRNGFAHDCTVRDENYNDITEATCHYLNRTWECYRFESVLHKAISQIAEQKEERTVEQWKQENGKTRISAKKRDELTAPIEAEKMAAYTGIMFL